MSKILFVSDIHLSLRKNKEFEQNRFELLFDFINDREEDILVLGGDIFDLPTPTLDEIALFYKNIDKVSKNKQVFIISGNHCDISKKECVFDKLPEINYKYFDITYEPIIIDKTNFYFVSHHKINEIKDIDVYDGKNVLFSHIRASLGIIKEEYPICKYTKLFNKIILGDIHIPYDPCPNVYYCGSPYTIQYEQQRSTGVFSIDCKTIKHTFIDTSFLPQKIKLSVSIEEYMDLYNIIKNEQNLYLINVSGDLDRLSMLPKADNIKLVIDNVYDSKEINDETIEEIIENKNSNVIDLLYSVIKEDKEQTENNKKAIFDYLNKKVKEI